MKKILAFLMLCSFVFGVVACGETQEETSVSGNSEMTTSSALRTESNTSLDTEDNTQNESVNSLLVDDSVFEDVGNDPNNFVHTFANSLSAAEGGSDEQFFYFTNDGSNLFRIGLDGSGFEKIDRITSKLKNVNVYKGYLYCSDSSRRICRYSTQDFSKAEILHETDAEVVYALFAHKDHLFSIHGSRATDKPSKVCVMDLKDNKVYDLYTGGNIDYGYFSLTQDGSVFVMFRESSDWMYYTLDMSAFEQAKTSGMFGKEVFARHEVEYGPDSDAAVFVKNGVISSRGTFFKYGKHSEDKWNWSLESKDTVSLIESKTSSYLISGGSDRRKNPLWVLGDTLFMHYYSTYYLESTTDPYKDTVPLNPNINENDRPLFAFKNELLPVGTGTSEGEMVLIDVLTLTEYEDILYYEKDNTLYLFIKRDRKTDRWDMWTIRQDGSIDKKTISE